ncbi:MAG: hypothetical protein ACFFHD_07405 [Promethearchaeota archaeon]
MYNNLEEPNPDYEVMLNKLSNQINDLFSKLHYYQALVVEKENQITRLTNEISQLKVLIQELSNQPHPPPQSYPNQQSYTPSTPTQQTGPPSYPSSQPSTPPTIKNELNPPSISEEDTRINKRKCPNCGAMGFAIKEVDDKSKILSYVPRRIYAKKRVCTKCRHEF